MIEEPETSSGSRSADGVRRAGISLGAFLLVFAFVWIVFDNLALALVFALIFGGGAAASQRAKKRD